MSSLSFFNIVFFFSFVSVIVLSNAEYVDDICKKVGNEQFCLEVLKSDSRSGSAKDIKTLTTVAVEASTKNTTATRDYFSGLTSAPPAVIKSLKDCIVAYNNVITDFKICMKEEDCSLIGYDIHEAGDEVRRCQAIADSNGAHESVITTSNDMTLRFCGLSEALANLMC